MRKKIKMGKISNTMMIMKVNRVMRKLLIPLEKILYSTKKIRKKIK
jgi:hypothetical protein